MVTSSISVLLNNIFFPQFSLIFKMNSKYKYYVIYALKINIKLISSFYFSELLSFIQKLIMLEISFSLIFF